MKQRFKISGATSHYPWQTRALINRALIVFFILYLQGCKPGMNTMTNDDRPGKELHIEGVTFHGCPTTNASRLDLVKSASDLKKLQPLKNVLGSGEPLEFTPEIDFKSHLGLIVSLGARPTPGYTLALASPVATMNKELAIVSVKLSEPDPDRILPQVISYPCIFLALPNDSYQSIRVQFTNKNIEPLEIAVH